MRKLLLCLAALAALGWSAPGVAAPEFRATYGSWRYDLSGTVTDRSRTYDLQNDLALESSGRRSVLIEWDTGPGWWPDWSASFSQLGASGYREYQSFGLDIFGNPFAQDQTITASADFDDFDLTARYPFRLGALDLAAGVSAKKLRGEVLIDDTGNPPASRQSYDETVPEIFASLRLPLGKALALAGSAQGIEAGGNSALEWRAGAELRLAAVLLEAGWQEKRYDLKLDDYALDARLDGAFARIGLVFR